MQVQVQGGQFNAPPMAGMSNPMLGHGLTTPQMGPTQHPMNPPAMQPGHGMHLHSTQMQQVRSVSRPWYLLLRIQVDHGVVSCPAVPTSHAKHFQVPEHAPVYDASSDNRTTRPRHGCAVAPPIRSDTNDVEPAPSPSPSAPRSEPQPAISPRTDVPREHHGVHKHDRVGAHGRGRRLRARLRGVVQPRARRHARAVRKGSKGRRSRPLVT